MNALQYKIAASITKHPLKDNRYIAKNHKGITVAMVQEVREMVGVPEVKQELPLDSFGGFCLRGVKVLSRRPAESAAKFIKRLPAGRGFDPKELAREWGMSEETIRRHARELGCLKFVEIQEDEWVPLVINPETAKQYSL